MDELRDLSLLCKGMVANPNQLQIDYTEKFGILFG